MISLELLLEFWTRSFSTRIFRLQNHKHNENMKIGFLGLLELDCAQFNSIRALAEGSGLSVTSLHNILKLAKVLSLNSPSYSWVCWRWLWPPDRILRIFVFKSHIRKSSYCLLYLFLKWCTFTLTVAVNKHNCRYWSNESHHRYREHHTYILVATIFSIRFSTMKPWLQKFTVLIYGSKWFSNGIRFLI